MTYDDNVCVYVSFVLQCKQKIYLFVKRVVLFYNLRDFSCETSNCTCEMQTESFKICLHNCIGADVFIEDMKSFKLTVNWLLISSGSLKCSNIQSQRCTESKILAGPRDLAQ